MVRVPLNLKSSQVRQTVSLFSATILSIFLSLIINIVLSKLLGPKGLGDFRFIITILTIFTTIFSFGFYQATGRLIVLSNDPKEIREIYGASAFVTLILYTFLVIFLFIYFMFDGNINSKGLFSYVYIVVIFGWVFLTRTLLEAILPSSNHIGLLALSRSMQPLVLLLLIIPILYLNILNYEFNITKLALILNFISFVIVYLFVIFKLKLSFKRLRKRLKDIVQMNRDFGLNVYIGGLIPLVVASLSEVLISYTSSDNTGVGFYSIAVSLCSLISIFPRIIASVAYRQFAVQNKIPKNILFAAVSLGILTLIFLLLIIKPFVFYFYGQEFSTVIKLCYILSIGVFFHGLADLLNKYLGANGEGKLLRNSSVLVGVSLLSLNITLIPIYGEFGAVVAASISGIIYFNTMYYYYRKSIHANTDGAQS